MPFPAVAGETRLVALFPQRVRITCQAFAATAGEMLQLCKLLGSLNPRRKVALVPTGSGASVPVVHQCIGTKLLVKLYGAAGSVKEGIHFNVVKVGVQSVLGACERGTPLLALSRCINNSLTIIVVPTRV